MKRLKVRKDVIIYHPVILVVEKGSILRCDGITFGVFGSQAIMNERTHKKDFAEYFEILEVKK